MHYTSEQINKLERFYKINLINGVSGYKSANLIATKSGLGMENVSVFSSVVHFGSNPPILGHVQRPTTVSRNTYDNIISTKYYTINHIHQGIFEDAHHTSAKYPQEISEFSKTKLNPVYQDQFFAPYVAECKVKIGLKYLEEYHIKANDTILILGEIQHLYVEDVVLQGDGFIDLAKANTATINGLDGYGFPNQTTRLPYQRPKK